MNVNKWTLGLASVGVIGFASVAQAQDEAPLSQVATALSGTVLSGYIDATATWKFGTGNDAMPGRTYDAADTQDGFNLNVVSLSLSKPLDEGTWSAGYHVQTLIGPNAAKRGTGLLANQPNNSIAFNEAYIALRVPVGNGIDLKVGQFGTYNGYEAFDTYKNPNWSRSYGFFIESSAHTGVSASYTVNDLISFSVGVANAAAFNNSVDARNAVESKKAYMGIVTLTAPESMGFAAGSTLSLGYTTGTAGLGKPTWTQDNLYIGLSLPLPVTGLSAGLAFDYTKGSAFEDSYAWALAGYLSYQATDKLKVNGRLDYAKGSTGSFGYADPDGNELFSFTATVDYALWKNVISRAELRWDRALEGDPFGGSAVQGKPTDDKGAVSVTANLIYLF